jgi:hypothetical protein
MGTLIIEKDWHDIKGDSSFFGQILENNKYPSCICIPNEWFESDSNSEQWSGGGIKLKKVFDFIFGCFKPCSKVLPDRHHVYYVPDEVAEDEVVVNNWEQLYQLQDKIKELQVIVHTKVEIFEYVLSKEEKRYLLKSNKMNREDGKLSIWTADRLITENVNIVTLPSLEISGRNILKKSIDGAAAYRTIETHNNGPVTKYGQTFSFPQSQITDPYINNNKYNLNPLQKYHGCPYIYFPAKNETCDYDKFLESISDIIVNEKSMTKTHVFLFESKHKTIFYMTGSYLYIINKIYKEPQDNELANLPGVVAQEGGKAYITILGRKRLIFKDGRAQCVRVKGEVMRLSEAKKIEKARKVVKS